MRINSEQAKKEFKNWIKDFLSHHIEVKPDDVWTLDLIAETISMKYHKDMGFVLENVLTIIENKMENC